MLDWSPPEGMAKPVASAWRAFYSSVLDKYGLTPDDYRLLYVAQKGRCWICRNAKGIHPDDPKGRGSKRLGVDHNHATGAVRGLLCTGSTDPKTCNRLIAFYTPEALQRAADYMRMPPAFVLTEMKRVEQQVNEAGMPFTDADRDRLAQAFLWGGRSYA